MEKKKRIGLLPRLLIAIALGIVVGLTMPEIVIAVAATFNGIFGNFLGFAIPLIILGFIIPGIADLGKGAGKMLAGTAGIAYVSTVVAGTLAFLAARIFFPMFLKVGSLGLADTTDPEDLLISGLFTIEIDPLMSVMTALVLAFCLGLGIAASKGDVLKRAADEFQSIVTGMIEKIIIPLLPIHVFGIFANMTFTGRVFEILGVFIRVFVIIIILHIIILLVQFTIAGTSAGKNPLKLLKTMLPAYLTAIGTQSSAATIPVTLRQTKENGVSDEVADFVIPLCATIHLSGSTVTLTSCAIAILMLQGHAVTFAALFPFILMLGVTMVAAPGVPGGAVMAALGILASMLGFDASMQALMIALYIAQDSFGTACNVTGDGAIAVLVDSVKGKILKKA